MKRPLKLAAIILLGALAAGCNITNQQTQPVSAPKAEQNQSTQTPPPEKIAALVSPISGGLSRVTKKPFGIKVSPGNSPINPERFSGYHTGIDFETTSDEQNSDVSISAVCTGKVALAKYATGYGGVLVQSCTLNGENVTIIYGHLRYASITAKAGQNLNAGEKFAVLGTGYSKETNGERKHLHLGIHKGTGVNILGYVQRQSDLNGWFDPKNYFQIAN